MLSLQPVLALLGMNCCVSWDSNEFEAHSIVDALAPRLANDLGLLDTGLVGNYKVINGNGFQNHVIFLACV